MYAKVIKRILDFFAAAALLVALSWLFLALGVLVAAKLGRPVIFRQERPGLQGRIFTMYKFRTMTDARYGAGPRAEDGDGKVTGAANEAAGPRAEGAAAPTGEANELLPDEDRLTPFGRKLRALSLDELPELVNILRGDMSFVGPRPLLVQYLPRYSAEQAKRHDVRPGLTGLAQVNGRNAISWEEKFAYDVRYVGAVSFALDCRVLAATLRIVMKREGVSAEGEATMPEFLGSEGKG
ncbi:MAG: sugar transferase [Clostridiales Family XIII bacterium]|jgi:lipopolysaccharide/colanic/teichoic acid biosynthesis glycosyltransferase|nr:sugar transferase [Clostridiales Family XIII bacterium]